MNNDRRKLIRGIVDRLSAIKEDIDSVLYDEQEAFDNMPEGLQQSARGEASQNALEWLESSSCQVDEAIGELTDAMEAA